MPALGSLLGEAHAPEQFGETWIVPQALPLGIDLEEHDPDVAVIAGYIKPMDSLILVAQSRLDGGQAKGPAGPARGQFSQFLQDPFRLRAITGQPIGISEKS